MKIRLVSQNKNIKLQSKSPRVKLQNIAPRIVLKQVGAKGQTGPIGPVGPAGPGLPTGGHTNEVLAKSSNANFDYKWQSVADVSDKTYTMDFSVSAVVNVDHNLNKYPAVTVMDSAGDEVEGEVYYISTAQLIVRFAAPFSGRVTCN